MHGSVEFRGVAGMWVMVIRIKAPGRYAIRLEVDGVTSPIFLFEARSKAARLEVIQEPKTRLDGSPSNVGDLFDVSPGNLTSASQVNAGAVLFV